MLTGFVIGWCAGIVVGIALWQFVVTRYVESLVEFWHDNSERWMKKALDRG